MNPYLDFVLHLESLTVQAKELPRGGFEPLRKPDLPPDAPKAMIFSPHPDDECIVGGLALRLMREAGVRIVNVAVTQGSNRERRDERYRELQGACEFLGFDLLQTAPSGLENINRQSREADPNAWRQSVDCIAGVLAEQTPSILFFPHAKDWNSTHIGVHHLVTDALRQWNPADCWTVETEYWGAMDSPNLMVELSAAHVADLVGATSFHVGEVARNPFHILQPAWMMDNVRRGAELVGGQGGAAPAFVFATLYRLGRWTDNLCRPQTAHRSLVGCKDSVRELFPGL